MTNMTEQTFPPPPPPPPSFPTSIEQKGFHGPTTHFFGGIRTQLTHLEQSLQAVMTQSPRKGLLVAFILSASMGIGLSLGFELLLVGVGIAGFVSIYPLFEEAFKGLSIFLVAWLLWKTIPSRRYGALLGAASGLGFAVVENIIFNVQSAGAVGATGGQIAEAIIARWLSLPFMHVFWSALVGVGIFVIMAQRRVSGTASWLVVPFWLLAWIAHMCWNGVAIAFQSTDIILAVVLDTLIVFTPFALIFRDFLGGHFNFRSFLAPLQEPLPTAPPQTFEPPPPPPPAY